MHSLANVECELVHGKNKKTFSGQSNWDYFVARSLCRENAANDKLKEELLEELESECQAAIQDSDGDGGTMANFPNVQLWWHWHSNKRKRKRKIQKSK